MNKRRAGKVRLSWLLGAATAMGMLVFGLLRVLGRRLPWEYWKEINEFLDAIRDREGNLQRRGRRICVEQHCPQLGGRLAAELRPNTSDIPTWTQVATLEDYGLVVDLLKRHGATRVHTIVDAGANIGLSSLYFAQAFPEARILAIEPDADNFALLSENVRAHRDQIECVQAAFWPITESVQMDPTPFRGGREWARSVRRSGPHDGAHAAALQVLTPLDARSRLGGDIDLLKVDIEGAEAEFFATEERCRNLLAQTRTIAIEVHAERIDPRDVIVALDRAGYVVFPGREILVALRRL